MECLLCDHELEHEEPPELFVEAIEHAEAAHPSQADLLRDMWGMDLEEAKANIREDATDGE